VGPTVLLRPLLAQKNIANCIIVSVRLVHRTEANKREDFVRCLRKRSTDGYTLCQAGNPDPRTYLQ
jgi:predicted deacetylase